MRRQCVGAGQAQAWSEHIAPPSFAGQSISAERDMVEVLVMTASRTNDKIHIQYKNQCECVFLKN